VLKLSKDPVALVDAIDPFRFYTTRTNPDAHPNDISTFDFKTKILADYLKL